MFNSGINKRGIAFSYVVIGAVAIIVLMVVVLIFTSQFSMFGKTYEKSSEMSCESVGGVCKPESECHTPASHVFHGSLSCKPEVENLQITESAKPLITEAGAITSLNMICCLD